jgi:hypothetical protein
VTLAQMIDRHLVAVPTSESDIVTRVHVGGISKSWRGVADVRTGWWWVLIRHDDEVVSMGFSDDGRLESSIAVACRCVGMKFSAPHITA